MLFSNRWCGRNFFYFSKKQKSKNFVTKKYFGYHKICGQEDLPPPPLPDPDEEVDLPSLQLPDPDKEKNHPISVLPV